MLFGGFSGIGLLTIILQIAFAVHAARRGQYFWIFLIIFVPVLGCLIYFLAVFLPEYGASHRLRRLFSGMNEQLDFGRRQSALTPLYPGEEARFRYGEVLARTGAPGEAAAQFQEIIRRVELQGGAYRRALA